MRCHLSRDHRPSTLPDTNSGAGSPVPEAGRRPDREDGPPLVRADDGRGRASVAPPAPAEWRSPVEKNCCDDKDQQNPRTTQRVNPDRCPKPRPLPRIPSDRDAVVVFGVCSRAWFRHGVNSLADKGTGDYYLHHWHSARHRQPLTIWDCNYRDDVPLPCSVITT